MFHIKIVASTCYSGNKIHHRYTLSGLFAEAHEMMIEALNMFNQVYGPLHPDIVVCYRAIARIHYLADDATQAVAFQKKAAIVAERIYGIDHPETLISYVSELCFCLGFFRSFSQLKSHSVNNKLYV